MSKAALDRFMRRAAVAAKANEEAEAAAARPANVVNRMAGRLAVNAAAAPRPIDAYIAKPANRLQEKVKQARTDEVRNASQFAEINRIVDMPVELGLDEEALVAFNRNHLLADAHEGGFRFFDVQANALHSYMLTNGGFHPIGVGWGKTLVTLMIAQAMADKGIKKVALFIPPEVLPQFINDVKWARTKVRFVMPVHYIGGRPPAQRRAIAKSNKPGLYVITYSMLSTKDTSEMMEGVKPQGIIADEAHKLGRRNAARTKRVLRYIDEHPGTEFVCLSGTITNKTIKDYYHLIKRCLKQWNPLPNVEAIANEWATMIDSQAASANKAGPLLPLCGWAQHHFPDEKIEESLPGFRKAYRLRLNSSPGVVASGEADIGTSLIFENNPIKGHKDCEGWDQLEVLVDQVTNSWLTPNGDEIEHAIHTWKWLNELSVGFYNELVWPSIQSLAGRLAIPEPEAKDLLARAQKHHAAGQDYARCLRQFLERRARPGLDTPLLVASHMAQHASRDVMPELYESWCYMKSLEFEDMPTRDSHAVRVCPFKVAQAVKWAQELPTGEGGIIWFHHQAIGEWLVEMLFAAGVDVLHCPAGDASNRAILDTSNVRRVVVASITAHGTGKNLQHFANQLFVQWPRGAHIAEQALGRTHRNGQAADELVVHTMNTLIFDHLNMAACINDSLYIHQTTGNRQKLIYGSYHPIPKIFPPEVLREKGLQNSILSAEQRAMMKDKFGDDQ